MIKLLLVFAVLSIVCNCNVNAVPPRFPNIGYVGSTYNLFKGNPHSTKGLDPGFTLRNMYEFTYLTNRTTADGDYTVPDGVNAVISSACSFAFTSQITQSTSSYKDSLQVDVSVDFKGWGASFSASTDYKSVQEGTSSGETTYITSQTLCEAYAATVGKAVLNPALYTAILQLPATSKDATPYIDFYNHWGTHYIHNLRMGGRYGVISSFSTSDFTDMSSTELDITASAGYSGLTSINVHAATTHQQEEARKFDSYRKDFQIYQVGGKPPLNESGSPYDWAHTVKANPLPLSYGMEPISEIMTPDYFPFDPEILTKQKSLQSAVVDYCQSLGLPDESLCNSDQPPDSLINVYLSNDTSQPCRDLLPIFKAPSLTSTSLYILGTLIRNPLVHHFTPFIVVEDSPLLSDPKGWVDWCNDTVCVLRPDCPDGFSSVSDFVCCDPTSINDCLSTIPRAKPCIDNKCLTECAWFPNFRYRFLKGYINLAQYGNPQLGAPFLTLGSYSFVRYVTSKDDYENRDLVKCLNFNCLQFEQ